VLSFWTTPDARRLDVGASRMVRRRRKTGGIAVHGQISAIWRAEGCAFASICKSGAAAAVRYGLVPFALFTNQVPFLETLFARIQRVGQARRRRTTQALP